MSHKAHLLVVGCRGQVGRALVATLSAGYQVTAWGRERLDISKPESCEQVTALRPDIVINAAAWTNVDGAEQEPEAAYRVNMLGPLYLAWACRACDAELVHISTNEVFPGEAERVYYEYDQPRPVSTYARSKLAGERAVTQTLLRCYIIRTAWVFGPGGRNFVTKIIAAARSQGALRVVDDEVGNPTYAPDLAEAIARVIEQERYGVYHLTNMGCCSRYEWAKETLHLAGLNEVPLTPISLREWPRPAPPPPHAVLGNLAAANLDIRLRPWQEALETYLAELPDV